MSASWTLRVPNQHLKDSARTRYQRALRSGEITRAHLCESCGRHCVVLMVAVDAAEPTRIVWLCRFCHVQRHSHPELTIDGFLERYSARKAA